MIAIQSEARDQTRVFRFPRLNILIEVCDRSGAAPQLEAQIPEDLFEGGFNDADWSIVAQPGLSASERSRRRHDVRNRMQIAGLSLDVLQRQAEDGDLDLMDTLDLVIESLTQLEASC